MNKAELITTVSEKSGVNKKDSTAVLDALIESITEALKAKDKVALVGFGTFETQEREARVGRNPKTGEEMQIEATVVPKFKAGKSLKDAVAGV